MDQKPKTLIIEHAARPGYDLLTPKAAEKTASAYRFEVKLPPSAIEKFAVNEEHVYDNTFAISNLTPDLLLSYTRNKALSDVARKQIEQIVNLKNQIASADLDKQRADTARKVTA